MRTFIVGICSFIAAMAMAQTGPVSSSLMNPNISVIGDFRGYYIDNLRRKLNIQFEEAEFAFISSIDPYAKADLYVSYGRTPDGEYAASLEEAYLTTLSLPFDLRLKAGKYRLDAGRLNTIHPHALPFSDMPAANRAFLGDDGLIDEAVSLSWLIPNPWDFYQEINFEFANGPSDSPLFTRPDAPRYLYLAHLKNFWEMDENTTLELGLSGLTGPNADHRTSVLGALDLTLKWKPLQYNRYKSIAWQSEFFLSRYGLEDDSTVKSWGMYSFLTYQVGERWFLTGRYDYTNLPKSARTVERGYSATLGWYATEFQKIEFGGRLATSNIEADHTEWIFRWIFVIGAHGAHAY